MKTSLLLALGLLLDRLHEAAWATKEKSAMCQACHGADGNSTDPQYPKLAGQHASYLAQALEDYRSGARKNPIMAGFAGGLSDADIANLAAYYASQKGLVTTVQSKTID